MKMAVKSTFSRNKMIFIALGVTVIIALACGFSNLKEAAENAECRNIIVSLRNDEFNFITFYLPLLAVTSAAYIVGALSCFNAVVFYLNLPLVFIVVRYFFRRVLIDCVLCGMYGYVVLFVLFIPLLIINFYIYGLFMANLHESAICGCSLKQITPLKCNGKVLGKLFKRYIIASLVVNIVYSALILIIFTIVY